MNLIIGGFQLTRGLFQHPVRQKPLSAQTIKKIEDDRAQALETYGPEFRKLYEWAAKHLAKRDPTIADIQEAAGIEHLGPYYRMASHNVHANPRGVFFKLGLIGELEVLLAGPSNAGLADPGHATAGEVLGLLEKGLGCTLA